MLENMYGFIVKKYASINITITISQKNYEKHCQCTSVELKILKKESTLNIVNEQ